MVCLIHTFFCSIQILVIIAGFMTSGLLINHAFTDWANNPVITTLDSIAAPITRIQFPTVTVCMDNNSPPDNWAFAETLLNVISFECDFQFYPTCGNTTDVREDFKDVYTKLYGLIKQWGNKHKDLNILKSDDIGGYIRPTAQYITDKKFSIKDLENVLLKRFNTHLTLGYILNTLGDYSNSEGAGNACTEKKCKGKMYLVEMILKAAEFLNFYGSLPFGIYISNFMNISGTTTFDPNAAIKTDPDRCIKVKPLDYFVHGYLIDLAEATGFTNGSFSLYDIPSMLATIDTSALSHPTIQQAFVYSQCKTTENFANGFVFSTCMLYWRQFLENNMTHPCDIEIQTNCCGFWTSKLGHNIKAIMKVMRMASRRGQSGLDMQHFMKPFEKKSAPLKYNVNPIGIGAYMNKISRDLTTILPWCKYANPSNNEISGLPIDACQLFQPVVTGSGICHSFNPTPSLAMLKESLFTGNIHD
jgi:hypothetical protein